MLFPLKVLSRKVHKVYEELHKEKDYEMDEGVAFKSLTVWRKSLLLNCNGFTVIDCEGDLVYRVDNYGEHPNEIILMDASGKSILSIYHHKQRLRLVDKWLIYLGEDDGYNSTKYKNEATFWAKKQRNYNMLQPNMNVLAHVYGGTTSSDKRHAYVIEGSYAQRSCKVYDESRRIVAEIKKKEALNIGGGVSFGLEVFVLIVRPGFDQAFAMAIVLLLDQMFN